MMAAHAVALHAAANTIRVQAASFAFSVKEKGGPRSFGNHFACIATSAVTSRARVVKHPTVRLPCKHRHLDSVMRFLPDGRREVSELTQPTVNQGLEYISFWAHSLETNY